MRVNKECAYSQEPISVILEGLARASPIWQVGCTVVVLQEIEEIRDPHPRYMRAAALHDLVILENLRL